jgi:hypothetical protein
MEFKHTSLPAPRDRAGVVPLDHGIGMTEVGVEPLFIYRGPSLHFPLPVDGRALLASRPGRFANLRTRLSIGIADPGNDPGSPPYENESDTCPACIDQGEGRTPKPTSGHEVLNIACLPVAPLGYVTIDPYGI